MVMSTSEMVENSSKKTSHLILKITLETLKLPKIKTAKLPEAKDPTILKVLSKSLLKHNKKRLHKQNIKKNHLEQSLTETTMVGFQLTDS
jgi:hypothetical protein